MKIGGMCLNWRIVAGLAAVGLGIWVVAPNLLAGAIPLLLLAACPLSMLIMMRGMQGSQCASTPQQVARPAPVAQTRAEQLADLKAQLAGLQVQHAAIAREIVALESSSGTAVREAEAVARAADEHVPHRA
jgi:hypothetical protein